ncbi:hypothetical protein CHGG_10823 [Chaetomium globosum CBS 148.51]|uniref:Endonuclease/exonuclease/phosphatase domain-containing protein n=1 Tax=Chaetomium globosum (strain ATCC 6205 / CBS 148.51 / DSM 1962 / NBRC 6347 / NRRL 1970) TaxID=306901 RepID=Q2GMI1_CHAGB|nr:uncharacterized protein CHGG_10823 [Chaetomium globosum CBS 148.51]EAQ83005.1 hypothetical protein CHGG_10823 [Chaetomium globosum CBS 148.51]
MTPLTALQALLEEAQYDLLAIQEPWINKQTKSTYCPRGSKVWFPGAGSSGLELWSIYNPLEDKTLLQSLLSRQAPGYPTALAGDFNLHHPLWDQHGRYERKAETLLELAVQWDLDLRTPTGTMTRAPQGSQRGPTSTIDHFWATVGLQTTYYGLEQRGKSDHYPQVLEVHISGPPLQQSQPEGWNWKMMKESRVEAEAIQLPLKMGLEDPGPQGLRARTKEQGGLEEAFDQLIKELQRIAEVATPRRKANRGHGSPWWSVEKATHRRDLLWNLERWARCKSFNPPDPAKLPTLAGPSGGPDLSSHQDKARALAGRFFPSPEADLSDIHDPDLLEPWEPEFNITEKATARDIEVTLSRISPWKAPGEDLLPTGLLKAYGYPLFRVLAVLTETCFRLGWFPGGFKRAKTVVLQKPGKTPETYRTPGGYRPIALLPTVGKVIEALVAKRVTGAAEAYGLLPAEQMGCREHRSTELAVRLVVAQVHEA